MTHFIDYLSNYQLMKDNCGLEFIIKLSFILLLCFAAFICVVVT
jgi:hypothetical protein